jgi:myosin protein heavy chain
MGLVLTYLQAHSTLKTERDVVESEVRALRDSETQWKSKHLDLQNQHSIIQHQFDSTVKHRDTLLLECSQLQSQVESTQQSFSTLQGKLDLAVSDLATSTRVLQAVQAELKIALRRADDAERTQNDLQAEGTNLMRSLDEMRPKIVELTGVKLELGEKVDSLQYTIRSRDLAISHLESAVEELQEEKNEANKQWQDALASLEAERSAAQENSSELQKAYVDLQSELESSRANTLTLEAELAHHRQEAAHALDEVDRLTVSFQGQFEELSSLRRELDERKLAQDEEEHFLERAHNEIESLRGEVSLKDEEIERLRVAASSNTSPTSASRSLDDEMLSTLKQQHELDISAAQSQIRSLETTLFEAEARAHSLQKQVGALEAQMLQSRSASRAGRPSRPSSRALSHADLRRSSFTSLRPSNLSTSLSRSVFDIGLTPDTQHKRRISLSMLKARFDSEVASVASSGSRPPSRAPSPAISLPTVREPSLDPSPHNFRPQFLDESHVFWCHCCRGDLVVL